MHRTNLILDDKLVKRAMKMSGEKSIKGTVHLALSFYVDEMKRREIIDNFMKLKGTSCWEGGLEKLYQLRKSRV